MRRTFALMQALLIALLIAGAPLHVFAKTTEVGHGPATATAEAHGEEKAGLPQLDPTLWPGQAFWLLISFALTYGLMRYMALPMVERTLDKRAAKLEGDIEQAKLSNEQAKALAAELNLRMEDARTRAADSVRDVIAENNSKIAAASAQQQKKLDDSLRAAEAKLNAEKDKALKALDDESAGMIEAILKRLTGTAPPADVMKAAWAKAKGA